MCAECMVMSKTVKTVCSKQITLREDRQSPPGTQYAVCLEGDQCSWQKDSIRKYFPGDQGYGAGTHSTEMLQLLSPNS